MKPKKLLLAKPRGFCAGVDRAIDVVEMALSLYEGPIYVRKEIVHNKHVIQSLASKGVIFVEEINEVPEGAVVIFSAHGVSPEVRGMAAAKRLTVIDATCPLVTKVHQEAIRFAQEGRSIILVGHEDHEEVVGTMGEAPRNIRVVGSVAEAETIQVSDPDIAPASDDICYATQNRQTAIKTLAKDTDLVLVIGSGNSSNSRRLKEVAESAGARAFLIDDVSEIDPRWLEGVECVGVTAGASAPEHLVQEVVEYFKKMGVTDIEEVAVIEEKVTFVPPPELVRKLEEQSKTTV
jgi:4-hydroxy-3-methylbut-2-enyl diphosphate reductase